MRSCAATRSVHAVGEFVTISADTQSAATAYVDQTVEPQGSYVYRVKAINAGGASRWSRYSRADTPVAPEPVVPEPQPVVPTPQPVVPEPQPVVPEPVSVVPTPEPVVSEPEPVVALPATAEQPVTLTVVEEQRKLSLSWDASTEAGAAYLVQWKPADEAAYDEDDQVVTDELGYTIKNLAARTSYTVAVTVQFTDGTSGPTATATGTPLTPREALFSAVEALVSAHEDEHPWLRYTWTWMKGPDGVTFGTNNRYGYGQDRSYVQAECIWRDLKCFLKPYHWRIDSEHVTDENILLHDLALTYIKSDIKGMERLKPISAAHLYIANLSDAYSRGVWACSSDRMFYDVVPYLIDPDAVTIPDWQKCSKNADDVPSVPDDDTLAVVRSAMNGEADGEALVWFSDHYGDDSAQVWSDITTKMPQFMVRGSTVIGLRDSFGGLCVKLIDLNPSIYSIPGAQVYVDPWSDWEDGTCALPTPTGLSISTGSDFFDVQWQAGPRNGNGNDAVTGYEVEWKSGDQVFGDAARTASVSGLSYTIEGLTNGTRYGIRVRGCERRRRSRTLGGDQSHCGHRFWHTPPLRRTLPLPWARTNSRRLGIGWPQAARAPTPSRDTRCGGSHGTGPIGPGIPRLWPPKTRRVYHM